MRSTRPSPLSLSDSRDVAPASSSPLAGPSGRRPLAASSLGLNGSAHQSSSPSSGSSGTSAARRALFKATPFSGSGGSGLWHDRFISACAERVRADRKKATDAKRPGLAGVEGEDDDAWGEAEEVMLRRMVHREWKAFKRTMTRQAELVEGLNESEVDRLLELEDDLPQPDLDDDDALAERFEAFVGQSDEPAIDSAMDLDDASSTPTGPAASLAPSDTILRSTLAAPCPSCGSPSVTSSMVVAPDAHGVSSLGCRACQWCLPVTAFDDAATRFDSMPCTSPSPHSLGIACVPYVGVLLICSRCDEQLVLA